MDDYRLNSWKINYHGVITNNQITNYQYEGMITIWIGVVELCTIVYTYQ